MEGKIISIAILVFSLAVGFGGGFIAKRLNPNDDDKIIKAKLITKAIALLGVIAALITSIYL